MGRDRGRTIELVADQMLHNSPRVTRRVYKHPLAMDRRQLAVLMSAPETGLVVEDSLKA